MSTLYVGWAEESLLPGKKIALAGQFYERVSDEIDTPLFATAMALEQGTEQAIIVSADIGEVQPFLMNLAREEFAKLNGEVAPEKLIFGATHTHTSHTFGDPATNLSISPVLQTINEYMGDKPYTSTATIDETVMTPVESTQLVAKQVAIAADKAWRNRKPGCFTNEFGRAPVGMCRRATYDDGSAQMWGDTNTANFVALEGGNDSGIELLYVYDDAKKLTGVVANLCCPSQILGQRSVISADFWGHARAILRQQLGEDLFFLTVCGAAGDQCPRDLVRWVTPETPIADPNIKRPNPLKRKADPSMYDLSGCRKAGKRIANEILSVLEEAEQPRENPTFLHKIVRMELPLRKVTMTQYREADEALQRLAARARTAEFTFADKAEMYVHAGAVNRFRQQQFQETFPVELHVMRLGDVAWVTCPFELFLDYGNRIKARSYAQQTIVMQLTCGRGGYLPTEKAEKGGHYSAYIASGQVGHEGGDLLTRVLIEEINRMFKDEN